MCSPDLLAFAKEFKKLRVWAKAVLFALLATGPSLYASAAPGPIPGRFELLRERDLRVATVAYRLSTANASQCKRMLAPQLGFVLHSIEQYVPADRAEAARTLALGANVGVMAVVAVSPAASAGLRAGDQLISVNGRSLGIHSNGSMPTRESVEAMQQLLMAELQRGAVTLRVGAADGTRDLRIVAAQGCPSNVELVSGAAVNAWADGSRVMVSEGLLARCITDDDLALVIGHELAHNLLHHRRRLEAEGITSSTLLPMNETVSHAIRETEEEADRTGVNLAEAAGYSLSDTGKFMAALLNPGITMAATHPDLERRLTLLLAAITEAQRGQEPRITFIE